MEHPDTIRLRLLRTGYEELKAEAENQRAEKCRAYREAAALEAEAAALRVRIAYLESPPGQRSIRLILAFRMRAAAAEEVQRMWRTAAVEADRRQQAGEPLSPVDLERHIGANRALLRAEAAVRALPLPGEAATPPPSISPGQAAVLEAMGEGRVVGDVFVTAGEKKCAGRCQLVKPLAEFSRDRHRADGHFPRCKECERARMKAGRKRWRESQVDTPIVADAPLTSVAPVVGIKLKVRDEAGNDRGWRYYPVGKAPVPGTRLVEMPGGDIVEVPPDGDSADAPNVVGGPPGGES